MSYNKKYFEIIKKLLPKSKLWKLLDTKYLSNFFKALTCLPCDVRKYIDSVYLDLFPNSTRSLENWEKQYGIINTNVREELRRNTIAMRWQDKGGQSAYYLQNILRGNEFNVFVYENNPVADPNIFMSDENETDWVLTNGFIPRMTNIKDFLVECGDEWSCGDDRAVCGYFEGYVEIDSDDYIPKDASYFPFLFFIGGEVERDASGRIINMQPALVPANRIEYFRRLILSIKPAGSWALIKTRS